MWSGKGSPRDPCTRPPALRKLGCFQQPRTCSSTGLPPLRHLSPSLTSRVSGPGRRQDLCLHQPANHAQAPGRGDHQDGMERGCEQRARPACFVSRERGSVPLPGAVSQTRDFHREPPTKRQSEGGLGPLGGVRRVRLQSGETLRPIWSLLGLPFKSPSVTRAQSSPAGSHVTPVPGTASGRDECGCLWPRQARPDGELATAERGSRKPWR